MITQKTAARIWECYREIDAAQKLIKDLGEVTEANIDNPHAQHLKDAFGRMRNLQLGIPSGGNGHQLYMVSPRLAESVIRAHIVNKQAELFEVNERARIELNTERGGVKDEH